MELDPYLRTFLDAQRQVVLAARPIVLAQDGEANQDGVVQVAANRDLIVIADEVTVRGSIVARRASGVNATTAPGGCTVLILARSIDTIPGVGGVDASIDVSGGVGATSTKIWTAAAGTGPEGEKGHSIWHPITDDVLDGGTGQKGDTGQSGDPGGDGGAGGTIDVRCGFTAPTTALAVIANGGDGGTGLDGQVGGTGGQGGAGANSEVYWAGNPSAATRGGKGGPGGPAGDGGAPGKGGAPGVVRLRVRNGQPNGVTPSLLAGTPGPPGASAPLLPQAPGGPPGLGGCPWGEVGLGGPGGNYPQYRLASACRRPRQRRPRRQGRDA